MTGKELREIRERLGMTQTELASALNQSYATVSRWERTPAEEPSRIPPDTARLMECVNDLMVKTEHGEADLTAAEIREAASKTGIAGIVVTAATAGLISRSLLSALAATTAFSWIGGVLGLGIVPALPFFRKTSFRDSETE